MSRLSRRQRKALIFGLVALIFSTRAIAALLDSGARTIEIVTLGVGAFGVGAAFRAIIGERRERNVRSG